MVGLFERQKMSFKKLMKMDCVFMYAGDIPNTREYERKNMVGLSLYNSDYRTICHDVTMPYPIDDNSIDAYQAEDVFEHVAIDKIVPAFNEIYRILKPGGYFRLSLPDYACDILRRRSLYDENGRVVFDPYGGGSYVDGQVKNGGHVWFPLYKDVLRLIHESNFDNFDFYHYYDENGVSVTKEIDYSKGWIQRTPDHDARVQQPYRAMSIVVDLYK